MSTNQRFDKSKLPSRHVTEGPARAPHRSYFYAMGITEEEIHQPWVGVATCWNEAAPCNIALNRQAQIVKHGVKKGGGTPREFTTITVTDGIAMGHEGMRSSLASRDAIADTVELTMRGHCYDALVGLAGCDKSLPGMLMAAARLDLAAEQRHLQRCAVLGAQVGRQVDAQAAVPALQARRESSMHPIKRWQGAVQRESERVGEGRVCTLKKLSMPLYDLGHLFPGIHEHAGRLQIVEHFDASQLAQKQDTLNELLGV